MKKILSIIVAVAMVITLMPAIATNVKADNADHSTWTSWNDSTMLPYVQGQYKLETDVTLTSDWNTNESIDLCLNGHKIVAEGRYLSVNSNLKVSIDNCKSTGGIILGSGGIEIGGDAQMQLENVYVNGDIYGESSMFMNYGKLYTTNCSINAVNSKGADSIVVYNMGEFVSTKDKITVFSEKAALGIWDMGSRVCLEDTKITTDGTDKNNSYAIKQVGSASKLYVAKDTVLTGDKASVYVNSPGYISATSFDRSKKYFSMNPFSIEANTKYVYGDSVLVKDIDSLNVYNFVLVNENYKLEAKGTDLYMVKDSEPETTTVAPTTTTTTETQTDVKVKATKIKKIKKRKKSVILTWKKLSKKQATGYKIRYSSKKSMKKAKIKKIKKYSIGKIKIKKLKSKKKYYFQIQTVKKVNGIEYVSVWSKKKSAKVK